jgi:hypothetical protein
MRLRQARIRIALVEFIRISETMPLVPTRKHDMSRHITTHIGAFFHNELSVLP